MIIILNKNQLSINKSLKFVYNYNFLLNIINISVYREDISEKYINFTKLYGYITTILWTNYYHKM